MGSIRPNLVKTVARQIYEKYENKLSNNFEENKKIVNEVIPDTSKKFRNLVAGYVTRYWKTKKIPRKKEEIEEDLN